MTSILSQSTTSLMISCNLLEKW